MKTLVTHNGFTLLELLVVLIIIGVLATLALPRLLRTVEFSRTAEALNAFTNIRSAVERCELYKGLTNCTSWANLNMSNPGTAANAHWTYTVVPNTPVSGAYRIIAERGSNEDNSGSQGNTVSMTVNPTAGTITKTGTGPYVGI